MDADTFRLIANRAIDGQAVLNQLSVLGVDTHRLAEFDPVELNATLYGNGS